MRRLQDGAGAGNEVDEDEDEEEGGNKEFRIRQEVSWGGRVVMLFSNFFFFLQKQAVQETEKVFGALGERIRGAVGRLEGMLVRLDGSLCFVLFFLLQEDEMLLVGGS